MSSGGATSGSETPWSFGVEPLPQTRTAAQLLRRITGLLLALETDEGELDGIIRDLRRTEARLVERVPADTAPRVGPAATSAGRVYLDHSRDIGAFNPCFPEYDITVEGDVASGTVTFPVAFEGPPGIVHGGLLAVFFDCVIQHHNCDLGVAGKTTSLSLRYRRPDAAVAGAAVRDLTYRRRPAHHLDRSAPGRRRSVVRGAHGSGGGRPSRPTPGITPAGGAMTSPTIECGDGLALTVPALLRERVRARPDAVLLACDDDVLTYAAADHRSEQLARGLLATGAGKGTHVGILHPNGSEFVTAWLAAARIGAVSVPLSTFSTSVELATLLRNADIHVLTSAVSYRSHDYLDSLGSAVPELDLRESPPLQLESAPILRRIAFAATEDDTRVAPDWTTSHLVAEGSKVDHEVLQAVEDAVTAADRMVIVHTSGSSSAPKGVIHCHGALIRHLDNLNELRRYTPDEVLFSNSPFFWIGGFAYALLGTLVAGAKLVCSNAATAAGVLDLLEHERPTMVNGFAQSVAHLPDDPTFATRDLSSIKRGNLYPVMPAAARPRDPELHHAMLGMTEAGSVCLVSDDESEQPERRRGSFGRPAPGFEASVIDTERGEPCGPNELGELLLRGPFMMDGYYGRERHEAFDADGWYHTGDLVVVDDDGFFYFQGRRGEMIKTSGANVAPREVEEAIREVAGLTAHVVGIDDADRGQIVAAAIRVPDGAEVDAEEIRSKLRQQLSAYKVPRRILLLPDEVVPMMSSGKLDLRALKDLFGDAG